VHITVTPSPSPHPQPSMWSARVENSSLLPHYVYTPAVTAQVPVSRRLPLVIWLHGGVWVIRGRDPGGIEPELPQLAFHRPEHQARHPCFLLRPIALTRKHWISPLGPKTGSHVLRARPSASLKRLLKLIDVVLEMHQDRIDKERLILAGASMGAYGVWDLLGRSGIPFKFAAALPVSGGGDPTTVSRMAGTRIWAFHSRQDGQVPVNASRDSAHSNKSNP
jgi:predicted peptidase